MALALWIGLAVIGCGDSASGRRVPGDSLVVLPPEPVCQNCRIELAEEIELRDGDPRFGGVSAGRLYGQDGRGRYYVVSGYWPSTVQVFESDGTLLGSFGRSGEGPTEFLGISLILIGAGDTLRIFDSRQPSYSVVSPDYEVLRRQPMPTGVWWAIEPGAGSPLVVNAVIGSADLFGYPLHRMVDDTLGPPIGSRVAEPGGERPEAWIFNRVLARWDPGRFYAALQPYYRIELLGLDGRVLQRIEGTSPWFDKHDPWTVKGRRNPLIVGLTRGPEGRLWVMAHVRSERFDDIVRHVATQPGSTYDMPILESATGDRDDLQESIVEVIDPAAGHVVARRRMPGRLGGFLGPDRIWAHEDDNAGGRIVIWRMRLVRDP